MLELNQVYQGDCLEVMKEVDNDSIDLTVTSPPYDDLRAYKGNIKNWNEDVWRNILKELHRVTKKGGVVVWVVGDKTQNGSETGTSFKQALWAMYCGFSLHDTMIYKKNNFANPSSVRYHQTFEYMFVFSKSSPKTFNPIKDRKNIYVGQKAHGKNRTKNGWKENRKGKTRNEYGMRHNVWEYTTGGGHVASDKVAHQHPAIFPEQLAHDHIISWSNPGDIVYDPMAGSGTVGMACQNLNRNYILIEKEPEYVEICKQRLKNNYGKER